MGRAVGILIVFIIGCVLGRLAQPVIREPVSCPKPAPVLKDTRASDSCNRSLSACTESLDKCLIQYQSFYNTFEKHRENVLYLEKDLVKCLSEQEYWHRKYVDYSCPGME